MNQTLRDLGVTGVINLCDEYRGPVKLYERCVLCVYRPRHACHARAFFYRLTKGPVYVCMCVF